MKQTKNDEPIKLSNRFENVLNSSTNKQHQAKNNNPSAKKHQITSVVHNISGKSLSPVEINVLERGLNFLHPVRNTSTKKNS